MEGSGGIQRPPLPPPLSPEGEGGGGQGGGKRTPGRSRGGIEASPSVFGKSLGVGLWVYPDATPSIFFFRPPPLPAEPRPFPTLPTGPSNTVVAMVGRGGGIDGRTNHHHGIRGFGGQGWGARLRAGGRGEKGEEEGDAITTGHGAPRIQWTKWCAMANPMDEMAHHGKTFDNGKKSRQISTKSRQTDKI